MPPVGIAYIATAIHNAGFELEILDIDVERYSLNRRVIQKATLTSGNQ